ncbi:MAG TPA: Gfo/Idh/MocA family oxidoreductase [Chloroflexota bacterium]|jgi:predicted dehydrogenase|nr:Gfo/Idh/MocA family oxidoreductase [Chloroflexota bacterium]
MASETFRVGVVGLGFIGRAQVDALRRIPGVSVVAVAGSRPSIRAAADSLGIANAVTDWRELVADPDIDVVHNCTPNVMHFDVNRATVEAGKACFAEKPLTVTSAEAASLVRLAAERDARVAVNFNHRGFPQVQQARALVGADAIGQVYAVHGSYLQDWLLSDTAWNWRVDPSIGGASRTVADIGSHWMDLVQSIIGSRIVELVADLHTAIPVRYRPAAREETFARGSDADRTAVSVESEDYASVLVRFANEAHGSFTVSQISAGRRNQLTFEIDGARGALAWNSEDSERLWIGSGDDAARIDQRDLRRSMVAELSTLPAGHAEGWNDALRNTIAGFYDVLRGQKRKPWVADWQDGWHSVALTEAILASHDTRRWTTVDTIA